MTERLSGNTTAVDQTFFVVVEASSLASGTAAEFLYRLQVTIRSIR